MWCKRVQRFLTILIFTVAASLYCLSPTQAGDVAKIMHAQLEAAKAGRSDQDRDDLQRFYELRDFQPAWSAQSAALASQALSAAAQEGLNPAPYRLKSKKKPKGQAAGAAWDIQLSAAVLRYARDVRTGRFLPSQIYRDVDLPRADYDAPDALNAALTQDALPRYFQDLPPQRPEYLFLRKALAHYRAAAKHPWKPFPELVGAVEKLTPETQKQLWVRLAAEDGQIDAQSDEPSLAELDDALRRFQARQDLDADGILGKNTVTALNVSPGRRVPQIKANMERWRWLPRIADRRYVEVNAASATLKAVNEGNVVLTSAVVIGHRESKTPLLATGIKGVVLNPAWPVPASIASNELFPKLLSNASYLQERNMVLINGPAGDPYGLTLEWSKVRRYPFPYVVQQEPGENNALGAFLLDMPNRFDVYLHDTPSKDVFTSADRYFSHGCVRVERIAELANFVVSGDPAMEIPQRAALARDKSQRLMIAPAVPVYFVYWTTFQGADGNVAFRDDVYGRDLALIVMLSK